MRARRSSGGSDPTNDITNAYHLAESHADFGQMTVTRGKTVAVIDLDHVSVPTLSASDSHAASGGSPYGLAVFAAQVDPGMNSWTAQKRIHAHPEGRAHIDFTDDGFADRYCNKRAGVAVNLRAGNIDAVELTFESTGA